MADPRRSVFLQGRRSSSSILLLRERTFARWIESSGVRSPLLQSFTSTPARFPLRRFRRSIPQSAAAPLDRNSVKLGWMNDGEKIPREDYLTLRSSSVLYEAREL
ncbi:hypothetical protein AMECASPLE_039555 [Ameca splendens]|uniref:Uncharacterized protein n=1 Tax=Ameca splendens TaxID=208324 RepID=A0ABV0ZUA8_9TELE